MPPGRQAFRAATRGTAPRSRPARPRSARALHSGAPPPKSHALAHCKPGRPPGRERALAPGLTLPRLAITVPPGRPSQSAFLPSAATNQGQGGRWGHLSPAPLPKPSSLEAPAGVGRPAPQSLQRRAWCPSFALPWARGRPSPPQSPLPASPMTAPRLEPEARTPCSTRAPFLFAWSSHSCGFESTDLTTLSPPLHPAQAPWLCPLFLSDSLAKPKPGERTHSLPCAAHGEGRKSGSKPVKICSTSLTT